MYCKKCGKELPEDSKFCPECGEQLDTNEIIENNTDRQKFVIKGSLKSKDTSNRTHIKEGRNWWPLIMIAIGFACILLISIPGGIMLAMQNTVVIGYWFCTVTFTVACILGILAGIMGMKRAQKTGTGRIPTIMLIIITTFMLIPSILGLFDHFKDPLFISSRLQGEWTSMDDDSLGNLKTTYLVFNGDGSGKYKMAGQTNNKFDMTYKVKNGILTVTGDDGFDDFNGEVEFIPTKDNVADQAMQIHDEKRGNLIWIKNN